MMNRIGVVVSPSQATGIYSLTIVTSQTKFTFYQPLDDLEIMVNSLRYQIARERKFEREDGA